MFLYVVVVAFLFIKEEMKLPFIISSFIASMIVIYGCYKLDFNFLETEKLYRMWWDFVLEIRNKGSMDYLFCFNPKKIKIYLKE